MSLPSPLTREFKNRLVRIVARRGGLLLCTDFDGTLVTFNGTPSETSLPPEREKLLTKLANLDRLYLAIISGRKFQELAELVPLENVTLAGNHGLRIRFEDGTNHELDTSEETHRAISAMKSVLQESIGKEEGIIIEDKSFGLVLHYRQYKGNKEKIKERFYRIWNEHSIPDLEVIKGAELLEVRPGNWNKGDAVQLLQDRWGKEIPTIYIGDDTTDEDAFRVLRGQNYGIPVLVDNREDTETEAQYRLKSPKEVTKFLELISEIFCANQ
ncbi:trehalose-phosphatase [Candidatus Bipolaricaulota bacterium]|nr:trehalose-phosphatase [Candidatus Bipolaricaulota bacterium]